MWAIRGRLVPLASDPTVAPNETAVFTGKVWMSDDGIIIAVSRGSQPGPPGSEAAAIIDVGSSLVLPGLIDLHNHLAYNTLPLWTVQRQARRISIVQATEDDVDLVVISGQRRYGTAKLMSGASTATTLSVAGRPMQLSLSQPSDASKAWEWSEVVDRLEEVRAHPKREVDAANAMYARWAGRLDDREAPL